MSYDPTKDYCTECGREINHEGQCKSCAAYEVTCDGDEDGDFETPQTEPK